MEGKKVAIEVKELDVLEQKIKKAADLVRTLRRERDTARTKQQETQERFDRLQTEFRAMEKERQGAAAMSEELRLLQEERQTVRGRVTRMLEMMAAIDDSAAQAQSDH
ncbi:MAG TPA: hypothetical protein VFB95_09460 [Candidatus Cryosericum sp.]|nr:hypothetical protein [Candidatus Cryosericum sp.]